MILTILNLMKQVILQEISVFVKLHIELFGIEWLDNVFVDANL
jgi:hypothetical protein